MRKCRHKNRGMARNPCVYLFLFIRHNFEARYEEVSINARQ